jgi:L-arabinose isomerase
MTGAEGRARVGLLLTAAQWFSDIGAQEGSGRLKDLPQMLERDTRSMLDALDRRFEVVFPGRVSTAGEASAAAEAFRREGIDAVVLSSLMWSEDGPLARFLEDIGDMPLLLWCCTPFQKLPKRLSMAEAFRGSGVVGCLQGSVPLRKAGARFSFVCGRPEDEALDLEFSEYAEALLARRRMKALRIGRVGPRCGCMTGTWIDDRRLAAELGPTVVPVSCQRLAEIAGALTDAEVSAFIRDLKAGYPVLGVTDTSLRYAARASLAVARLAAEEDLGVVSIEDLNPELHRLLKTRPCLWPPGLRERGAVVGMEADVLTALGLWVSRQFCGHTPMYSEVLTFATDDDVIPFGHGAMHDPELAGENKVSIVPDYEFEAADEVEGAWLNFRCRPGRVTLVNLCERESGYGMFAFRGEALKVPDEAEGFTCAYVKPDAPPAAILEKAVRLGVMQHYALSYGDLIGRLRKFCDLTGIGLDPI